MSAILTCGTRWLPTNSAADRDQSTLLAVWDARTPRQPSDRVRMRCGRGGRPDARTCRRGLCLTIEPEADRLVPRSRCGLLAPANLLAQEAGQWRECLVDSPECLQVPQAGQHDRSAMGHCGGGQLRIPRGGGFFVLATYHQGRGLHMAEVCPARRCTGPGLQHQREHFARVL